ncbi:hypothetical protein ABVR74_03245 [Lactococcus lactis subsp. lactis]|uniref:hypothetical protein n=1 Tax=Lactococcus lactis TaxID=1358 RepID=UPI00338F4E93
MILAVLSNRSFDWVKMIKSIILFKDGIDRGNLLAISAILLGLLIPIAIFLVEDAKGDNYNFERSVIFTEIIKKRDILWTILLLTFPLLSKSIFVILLYFLGLILYYQVVKRCLMWINIDGKTNEDDKNNEIRYSYLKRLDNLNEQIYIWEKIWGDTAYRKTLDKEKLMGSFLEFYKNNYIIIHYEKKDKKLLIKARKYEKKSDSMTEFEEIKMINLRKYTDINRKIENILLILQKNEDNFRILFTLIVDRITGLESVMMDDTMNAYKNIIAEKLEIERTILKKNLLFLANNQNKIFDWDLVLDLVQIASFINGLEGKEQDLFVGENITSFEKIPWEALIEIISKQREELVSSLSNFNFDKVVEKATQTQSEIMNLGRKSKVGDRINALIGDDPFFD